MIDVREWVKRVAIFASFGAGLGLGSMGTYMFLLSDHPSIIVQDRWRVVEVPTPPATIQPTTPFGIDPNVYILDVPITTTTEPATTTTSVPTTTTSAPATTATTIG